MNFDLEFGNCFLIKRNDKRSLVVDKDVLTNKSKIEVGTIIEFTQVFQTYEVTSIFYDFINGIYILGLKVHRL